MGTKTNDECDLSLEVVILLILGVFMLLFGLLLFSIHTGDLPYTPDSMYGLFLVIVAFQTITMGKTPFGDLRRSWMVVIIGICTALLGMLACFVPGYLTNLVRILVGIMLLAGGIALLFQLFISQEKARTWVKISGILRQLIIASSLVYLISVTLGLVTLLPGIFSGPQTSALLIPYGISFLYLSWCIRNVSRRYPHTVTESLVGGDMTSGAVPLNRRCTVFRDASLPLSLALLILVGVLLLVLGLLLIPVNLGIIPFSPDGQLGLLLVITAIQMMALGQTPLGQYKRSWIMIVAGVGFASMGAVSCIVPGMLTNVIRIFLGFMNITGGVLLLTKRLFAWLHDIRKPPAQPVSVPPILKKLQATQTTLYIVSIAFGVFMFMPGLVPGMVIAGIVVINGLLLFVLASVLQKLE